MLDPRTILDQARHGPVPPDWRVFTKRRGKVSGFFHGTSHDPDPLLVITPECVVEYAHDRKPLSIITFCDLTEIALKAAGQSFSDSSAVSLSVWLDLIFLDGRKSKWRSMSFADNLQTVQGFIEAYGAHKALHGR
ncbi:hypothetical protein [Streptomyces naphthomycinicus]|uniref:hypothetical protein n=1 Tax=Streptomyces naphthomycinicus TaxID=2872625 RepID=UPI001CECA644|nr:hypothetical protein [Streptomyces sp. TML10]